MKIIDLLTCNLLKISIMKRLALIGTSGGGKATTRLGAHVVEIIEEFLVGFVDVQVVLSHAQFIVCNGGLDFPDTITDAALWTVQNENEPMQQIVRGTLQEANQQARKYDEKIALAVKNGEIDAIIAISCDPGDNGVNFHAFEAARQQGIPVVGTGGTSISYLVTKSTNIIGCSGGSVATSPQTRAICFFSSLASYWGVRYILPSTTRWPSLHAVAGGILPILMANTIATSILKVVLKIVGASEHAQQGSVRSLYRLLRILRTSIVPVAVGALSCMEASSLGDVALVSGGSAGGLLAGTMENSHGFLSAYCAGTMAAFLLPRLLRFCAAHYFLPTAATIASVGLSGLLSGIGVSLLLDVFIAPLSKSFLLLFLLVEPHLCGGTSGAVGAAVGAVVGWLCSWGSEHGYYHSILLPLIAVEMQSGGLSVIGAFDLVCLCMPCAGVCAAVHLVSLRLHSLSGASHSSHRRLGWKGFTSNVLFGDFVEACYPYTVEGPCASEPLRWAVRVACAVAGAILGSSWRMDMLAVSPEGTSSDFFEQPRCGLNGAGTVRSSAYLPLPLAVALSWADAYVESSGMTHVVWRPVLKLVAALLVAFAIPFLSALILLPSKIIRSQSSDS